MVNQRIDGYILKEKNSSGKNLRDILNLKKKVAPISISIYDETLTPILIDIKLN